MIDFLNSNVVHTIGWSIVHSIWQGGCIAFLYFSCLVIFRNATTRTKYLFSAAFLLIFMACFIITVLVLSSGNPAQGVSSTSTSKIEYYESSGRPAQDQFVQMDLKIAKEADFSQIVWNGIYHVGSVLEKSIRFIFIIWLAGFLFFFTRLVYSLFALNRFRKKDLHQPSSKWQKVIDEFCERANISRKVKIFFTPLINSPLTLGYLKPMIYFPLKAITGLTQEEIRSVLMHEIAHIIRNDYLANILQNLAETLFFYHPAIWWLSENMRIQREIICDEFVLKHHEDKKTYMSTLIKLEEQRLVKLPVLAAKNDNINLLKRLKTMNNDPERRKTGAQHYLIILSILIFGIMLYSFKKEENTLIEKKSLNDKAISYEKYDHSDFIDSRDGQTYKTIKIGDKWWMQENLNYNIENSWSYNNDPEISLKWGRLYTWEAALKACPDGWHVASDDEWKELEEFFGIESEVLNELGWRNTRIGEFLRDENIMYILDGGYRPYGDGTFDDGGDDAYYWTSTSLDNTDAWKRFLSGDKIGRGFDDKRKGFSVRCVRN